jgi:hypothetical protein
MPSDKPSSVSHRPGFGRAGSQSTNGDSRNAEFCREAQSENGSRSVCAFIRVYSVLASICHFCGKLYAQLVRAGPPKSDKDIFELFVG